MILQLLENLKTSDNTQKLLIKQVENKFGINFPNSFQTFLSNYTNHNQFNTIILKKFSQNQKPIERLVLDDEQSIFVSKKIKIGLDLLNIYKDSNIEKCASISLFHNIEGIINFLQDDSSLSTVQELELIPFATNFDCLYWCIGIGSSNYGQIFYCDWWNKTIYKSHESFDYFLNDIFIGIEIE